MEKNEQPNSFRFINAYNNIDQTLRSVYNMRRSLTFSDMIRRVVSVNSVVRKYEDKLIDYARLRNAIIHNSNEERVIAEPHDDVVGEMEHIAELISRPPRVMNAIKSRPVLVLDSTVSVKKAIETISQSGFKNIPVYEDGRLIGVATTGRLVDSMGHQITEGKDVEEFISNTTISEVLSDNDINRVYAIRDERLTVQEALDMFYNNRKLLTVILTKRGTFLEPPVGIITGADIIDLNKVMEDYDV